MFTINTDQSIHLTRGDIALIVVNALTSENQEYVFKAGDIVRFKVFEKGHCDNIVLEKDINVLEESTSVEVELTRDDTKIGEIINKPRDYWYEVEVNPDTTPQTIVGYDASGPKVFRLYPEGGDK